MCDIRGIRGAGTDDDVKVLQDEYQKSTGYKPSKEVVKAVLEVRNGQPLGAEATNQADRLIQSYRQNKPNRPTSIDEAVCLLDLKRAAENADSGSLRVQRTARMRRAILNYEAGGYDVPEDLKDAIDRTKRAIDPQNPTPEPLEGPETALLKACDRRLGQTEDDHYQIGARKRAEKAEREPAAPVVPESKSLVAAELTVDDLNRLKETFGEKGNMRKVLVLMNFRESEIDEIKRGLESSDPNERKQATERMIKSLGEKNPDKKLLEQRLLELAKNRGGGAEAIGVAGDATLLLQLFRSFR